MKAVLALLVLVVVVVVGVEWAAPRLLADRVEQRANARLGEAATVEAHVGTFPFVPRLLADNRVRRVTMTLEEIAGRTVTFGSASAQLRGIVLDRQKLFAGEVEVTAIDSGTVTVSLDQKARNTAGELLPDTVDLAQLSQGQSVPLALPPQVMPCTPRVQRADNGAHLSCEFTRVPPALVRAAG